jgi:septal ring factor EnvC (AmiA/AmiB activator)
MRKWRWIMACAAMAGVLVTAGGCVSQSTYDQAVANLNQTKADLDATRAQVAQSHAVNSQLRGGLSRLADETEMTAVRVRSAEGGVKTLKANGKRASECLAELQQILTSQERSIAALEETVAPLLGELAELRKRANDLAGQPAPAPGSRMMTYAQPLP